MLLLSALLYKTKRPFNERPLRVPKLKKSWNDRPVNPSGSAVPYQAHRWPPRAALPWHPHPEPVVHLGQIASTQKARNFARPARNRES
jgi:hypothetical protein